MILLALFLFFQSAIKPGGAGSQAIASYTPPPVNEGVTVTTPPFSYYGYPTLVIPGADRQEYRLVYGETDHPASWGTDGSGNIVMNVPGHNMQVNDYVVTNGFTATGQFVNMAPFLVTATTADTYTLNSGTSGTGTTGTETTAVVNKVYGPDFDPLGTWTITTTTACGGVSQPVCPKFHIYTQDESQDTGYVTAPTLTGIPPYMQWGVDPASVGGDCSHTGSITTSNFTLHSTIEFDVTFTSADNPSATGTHHYALCKVGGGFSGILGKVQSPLGFRTVYANRYIPIVGQVFGNTNQRINWTIETAPAGGNASLLYETYPQAVFNSGTVQGLYRIKGCPAVDSSSAACAHVSIWVSTNAVPAANPEKAEQVPCPTDTAMGITWGSTYDIKPSTATPDLLSIPQNPVGPMLIRVWNTGANGSPTEYHNQLQVNLPSGGPFADNAPAVFMCGVPNAATGELPIIDGADATVNSWASSFIVGPYSIIGFAAPSNGNAPYNGQQQPFAFVSIEGLHVRNVTTGYNYYVPGGGDTGTWGGSMGIRPYGIQHWAQIGNHTENVADPFFDDCNTHQSGWAMCTISTLYEGNHMIGYGLNGSYLDHPFYLQAEGGEWSLLNLLDGAVSGSQGTGMFSDRGFRSYHQYERVYPQSGYGTASGPGGHSDAEDSLNYVTDDEFWGYQGSANCGTQYSSAPGCQGITGVNDMDWFAAIQEEHSKTDFVIANTYYQPTAGNKLFGISITHGTDSFRSAVSSQWGRLSLQQWLAYNSVYIPQDQVNSAGVYVAEDVRLDGGATLGLYNLPQTWPRFNFQNNILPFRDNTTCAYNCGVFGTSGSLMARFQTNMVEPGQITITNPLIYTGWSAGGVFQSGINQAVSYWQYGNISPINRHLAGFSSANFPTYTLFPFDTTTFIPSTTSDAAGKATSSTGELAYYPPRFNAVDANMSPFTLRTDLTTVGAFDPSAPIPPADVTITPSMTESQIQTAINGSAVGNVIAFTGGDYNLASNGANSNNAALVFPAGRTYIGSTSGVPTHLIGTGTYPLIYFTGTTLSLSHFEFDNGLLFLEDGTTSATISNNIFENIDCGVNASQTSGIFVNGGINNSTISSNTFRNIGQTCNAEYQNTLGAGGITFYGFHNLDITHNIFTSVYEGIDAPISGGGGYDGAGGHWNYNTFSNIHRIAIEFLGTATNPSGLEVAYNNYSNPLLPWAYTFGLSLTAGQNMIVHDNIINANVDATGGNYVPYGIEIAGVGSSAYNNVVEGYWGWGFSIGNTSSISITNNKICGPTMNAAPSSGSTPVSGNANGFISWQGTAGTGTFTGNTTSSALTCE